jgi:FHA domain
MAAARWTDPVTPKPDEPDTQPLPGNGLVAHERGLWLVCAAPDRDSAPLADRLLEALADTARAGRDAAPDGSLLISKSVRIVTSQLGGRLLPCAVAGQVEHGLAVLASGGARVRVVTPGGEEIRLGEDPQTSIHRIINEPVARLEMMLDGDGDGEADARLRLGSGIVRGRGLVYGTVPEIRPVRSVRVAQALPTMVDQPLPEQKAILVQRNPFGAEDPHERPAAEAPMVLGVNCKNGHFNDPRTPYCAICGISMVQMTLSLFRGPRPPLGVLFLDDGVTISLDADQLIGREPEQSRDVSEGRARPLRLTDQQGSISRRHVLVTLDEWQVKAIDLGSVNGTDIRPPGAQDFQPIGQDSPVVLETGTTVRVGRSRTFRFESNRKA